MACRGILGIVNAANVSCRINNLTRKTTPLLIAVRNYKSKYQAGPYPTTPEERKAAAKKYNLPEEWYEPYPDDGMGYGDYPKLPLISTEARDDYYPWDYPEYKRNFDEPIHAEELTINDTRCNVNQKLNPPLAEQWLWFLGTLTLVFALDYYLEDYDTQFHPPVLAKELGFTGETHYAFNIKK